MGVIVSKAEKRFTTSDGMPLVRRVTKVMMPNGKFRYPVDYYDATPGVTKVTKEELQNLRVSVYQQLI